MANSHDREPLYLGLDLSTQQLKAVIIDSTEKIRAQHAIHFDNDLPEYRTEFGAHVDQDGKTVTAPIMLWLHALDMLFEALENLRDTFSLADIVAISGCAQQHGSVYWKTDQHLKRLDPQYSLHTQLGESFAVMDCPIWMDSSTTDECKLLEDAVGGAKNLAEITGSRAYERFTASQIAKMYRKHRQQFYETERISLVSSFLASIFLACYAPIDYGDASGMNLMRFREKRWSIQCLDVCAPGLLDKLGGDQGLVPTTKVLGTISHYFVKRYGFSPNCQIVAFTGDNLASMVGMNLQVNDVIISMGSSDTLFMSMETATPTLEGHVFCSPINSSFVHLLCFKNGSLVRDAVLKEVHENLTWDGASDLLKKETSPAGNEGRLGFYFDYPEILPPVQGRFRFDSEDCRVDRFEPHQELRAVLESQVLAKRYYAERMGLCQTTTGRILVTGGVSNNMEICQMIADVFQKNVYILSDPNSAPLGGAILAKMAVTTTGGDKIERSIQNNANCRLVATPDVDNGKIYQVLLQRYGKLIQGIVAMSARRASCIPDL